MSSEVCRFGRSPLTNQVMALRTEHRFRVPQLALSGSLISATIVFAASCGGHASNAGPRADSGFDGGDSGVDANNGLDAGLRSDAGQGPDATCPSLDVSPCYAPCVVAAACVPLEQGSECAALLTGCPSVQMCLADGSGFFCDCKQCDLELASTDCAWHFEGDYIEYGFQSGSSTVRFVAPDGGQSQLPEVETQAACGNSPGWYAEGCETTRDYVYTSLTFHLCPASCSQHQRDPGVSFMLRRDGCPIQ